ncbi:MAG: serine/threonine-protein kinase [Acidobacteria bacterium]|nr:serine/threonine-protein kinase [Acidobacteriota bacterium]
MIEEISHYKIIKRIGAGGMGEVFLAEDSKLGRKVALKVLPAGMAVDRKRLNRFLQEARLAANLNHPHICTIYEIDATADTPFLAMELVQGETLAERIERRSVSTDDLLSTASQIADALDEAHRAGIIHRDIKSSNIIVNHRGQIKILDFGLAKSMAEDVSDEEVTRAKTEDGMLVGTVQYMSPEQALGKNLDGRTDLWSLGVLLYEMVTGELPFKAPTQAGTFDSILNRPPAKIEGDVPPEVVAIIEKLLEKDRDLRYQTASDLLADLRRLRRARGDASESGESLRVSATQVPAVTGSLTRPTIGQSGIGSRRFPILTVFPALILIAASALVVWKYFGSASGPKVFDLGDSTRQTNLGKVVDAVISPAGDHIVYVTDDGAKQALWIKQTSGGSVLQIVPASESVFQGIAVSPDNKWVYYNVWDRVSVGQVYRIPALGGVPQKIVHDCMPGISVAPDGSRLTFVRSDDRARRFVLLTIASDGTDEREVLSLPGAFAYRPIWAPDGKSIAFGLFENAPDRRFPQIAEIPAGGGEIRIIWRDETNKVQPNRFVWLPDKTGLLVTLVNSREFRTQIWQLDYPSGNLRQITKDLNSYGALSVSADGRSMLAVQEDLLLSVWNVSPKKPALARRITDGKTEGIGLSWTADNRLVYSSNVSGNAEIWMMNEDGTGKRQLTSDATPKLSPCVSGDGKYVFYAVIGNERGGSARMELDGRNQQTLENKWGVTCAAGSNHLLYLANVDRQGTQLFRDTTDFNAPVQLPENTIVNVSLSPDGKRVATVYWDEEKRRHGFEIIDIADGKTTNFELPTTAVQKNSETQFVIRWTPDGKSLSFVNDENGFANVWILPLNGEKPRRITNFNDNFIFGFAWSQDGEKLAVSRGTLTSDAVLFRF